MNIFRFLLVSLNIEAILEEPTIHRRREQLSKIRDGLGLGDAYRTTIERIKAQSGGKSRLGFAALMLVSHAERPLTANELCHALAVELGSKDFNAGNVPSISTVVSCCQGLVSLDKEASVVRLIHFTLKEYLSTHHDIFSKPHAVMAEICLTYLNSKHVKALSPYPSSNSRETTFLEYCSLYWGVHAKKEFSDLAKSLALELFRENVGPGHLSTELLVDRALGWDNWHFGAYFPFNGLHCASFFGIVEVVAALIVMGDSDLNGGDFRGYTPLSWAACNGHEEVVKLLLGQEAIDPDKPDRFGGTPLFYAAWGGHEGVMRMLLEREEVNPDKTNDSGRTPLLYAAWAGHEGVVKMLLGRGEVSPDKQDDYGKTPLSYAAREGHEGVVRILLGREEVNPDKQDNHCSTPLSLAAEFGHDDVVKILLRSQEVDLENIDNDGDTPLACAAIGGCERVVRILLEKEGVNPDRPNNTGQTPLSIAARKGHVGVVEILLGREEVNPNTVDNDGQTPLQHAAKHGHHGVTELLQHYER